MRPLRQPVRRACARRAQGGERHPRPCSRRRVHLQGRRLLRRSCAVRRGGPPGTETSFKAAAHATTDSTPAAATDEDGGNSERKMLPTGPPLVHSGLDADEELRRLGEAAAERDGTALLAVLTAACAFPEPRADEPRAALLLLRGV